MASITDVTIALNEIQTELDAAHTLARKLADELSAEKEQHEHDLEVDQRQLNTWYEYCKKVEAERNTIRAKFEKSQRRVEFLERRLSQLTRDNLIDSEAKS